MKRTLALTAVGALALGLAACSSSGGGTTGQTFANGKTFTMVLGTDPGTLDPHFTALASAGQVDRFLYDSLVNVDVKLAELMPEPTQTLPMVAVAENLFVVREPNTQTWIPVTFYHLPTGERYVHFGVRATPKVD